jgi:hypothetical protein
MESEKITNINVQILRDQLRRLSEVKDTPIKNLGSDYLDDFVCISNNISNLYGTDGYNLLFKEIQEKFPMNVKVVPGTVSGYFLGCFAPTNFKYGDTCSLSCVTGAPTFYDNAEVIPCQRNVFIAPFDSVGYTFTKLSSGNEDPKSAILFIQPPFQGFTQDEIKQLKGQGLENIIVSYYDDSKGEYNVSDPISFEKIKKRNGYTRTVKVNTQVSKSERIFQIVGVIILLILAGFALWSMRNN